MSTIRNGKIARLPAVIREEVNQRLANHESSTPLLKWLNALPEVQAVMAEEFGGKAIGPHNLYEWRHGGYAEWWQGQEARAMMQSDAGLAAGLKGKSVTEITAQWLAVRYAVAMKSAVGQAADPAAKWKRMRECCHDVVALRRGEYRAERLEFDRKKANYE